MLYSLWLDYDMKEPFIPQLSRNAAKLTLVLKELQEGLSKVNL